LFDEHRQPVLDLKGFFNRKGDSWELEKIIANGLGDIETGITKNAPEPEHVRCALSGKVHEFQMHLL